MPVEYINATNYDAAVAMMGSNKVDLGWFGGVTGVDAVDACRGEARMIATRQKDLQFEIYFVANRAVVDAGKVGPVRDLADLKPKLTGLSFTFGNLQVDLGASCRDTSCRGRHRPRSGRQGRRQEPGQPHDDAGDGRGRPRRRRRAQLHQLRARQRREEAAGGQDLRDADLRGLLHGRADSLGDALVDKIRAAFTKLDPEDPEHRAVLDAFKAEKFVAAESSQWQMIRDVMKGLQDQGQLK